MNRPLVLVTAAVVVAALAVSAWAWPQIPDGAQVPIHWGINGQADGFAPKPVGLLLLPGLIAGIGAVFVVLPAIEPRREHLRRSGPAYRTVAVSSILLLGAVHVAAVMAATGRTVDIARIAALAVGALFVAIGNVLPKLRSTFLVGIRTPWTLTSERSWTRTHRLGGRLMALLGLSILALTAVGLRGVMLAVLLGVGAAVLVAGLTVYSYLVWRSDPDRRSFGH